MRKEEKMLEADALDLEVLDSETLNSDARERWVHVQAMLKRPAVRFLGGLVVLSGTGVSAWALWDILLGP